MSYAILAVAQPDGSWDGRSLLDGQPTRFGPMLWTELQQCREDLQSWAAALLEQPGVSTPALPDWLYVVAPIAQVLMVLKQDGQGWVVMAQAALADEEPNWQRLEATEL
jgi:hypothetical protein